MGAELFHADGETDMNLIIVFRNFANAPKKQLLRINLCCTKSWRTILDSASVPPLDTSLTIIISELLSDLMKEIQVTAFCPKNGIWSEKKNPQTILLLYTFFGLLDPKGLPESQDLWVSYLGTAMPNKFVTAKDDVCVA